MQPVGHIPPTQVGRDLANEAGVQADILKKVAELLQSDPGGIIDLEVDHVMRGVQLVAGRQHVHLMAQLEDFILIAEAWRIHKKLGHKEVG